MTEHQEPLGLTPAERYEIFYKYLAMEGAANETPQGADVKKIIEDLAVEYVTTDQHIAEIITENTIAGPC
jgi:hypothetical protein